MQQRQGPRLISRAGNYCAQRTAPSSHPRLVRLPRCCRDLQQPRSGSFTVCSTADSGGRAELSPGHQGGNLALLARERLPTWLRPHGSGAEKLRWSRAERAARGEGGLWPEGRRPPRQGRCSEAPCPLPPCSRTHVLSVTPSCSVFSASPPAEGSWQLPPSQTRGSLGNLFLHAAFTFTEKTVCGSGPGRKANAGRGEVEEMLYSSRGEGKTAVPCRQTMTCPSSASERPAGSRRCASIGPQHRPYRGRSRRERIPGSAPLHVFLRDLQTGGRFTSAKQT